MKKILSLALVLMMLLSLTACIGGGGTSNGGAEQGSSINNPSESGGETESDSETSKPATGNKLKTPSVFIDEDGNISWYDVDLYDYCSEYLLSVNGEETKISDTDVPDDFEIGDVIKVKALASGSGTRQDSDWSEEFIYGEGADYDFLGCGFESDFEKALIFFEEGEPGSYIFGANHKCSNGDLIIFEDSDDIDESDFIVYTRADGYKKYDVNYGEERTDYCLTDYKENKKQYYTELAVYAMTMELFPSADTSNVFASADEYIASRGINLLEYCEVDPDNVSSYELAIYTEYSETVDVRYLNHTFMHPETRKFEYLSDYAGKITSWTVKKATDDENYIDVEVDVQFNQNFDHNDFQTLVDYLAEFSLRRYDGGEFSPAKEGLFNAIEGRMPVYSMPFQNEGDNWYDKYKLSGWVSDEVTNYPYMLSVFYQVGFSYDGGTNAYYFVTPDGLWRRTHDNTLHMIEKDGNRLTYDYFEN